MVGMQGRKIQSYDCVLAWVGILRGVPEVGGVSAADLSRSWVHFGHSLLHSILRGVPEVGGVSAADLSRSCTGQDFLLVASPQLTSAGVVYSCNT